MTAARSDYYPTPPAPAEPADVEAVADLATDAPVHDSWPGRDPTEPSPLRKAAIVLVSLEQSLASQLLSHLDRSAVEMITWEIARLDRVDPDERAAVLEEFYGLGVRRLCFVFDDVVKMGEADIRAAFHEEDIETWALALAGAAASVRAKVIGALAASTSDALKRQLEATRPVPALRFRGRSARDCRPAPAALRPRLGHPPRAERERRGPRLNWTGEGKDSRCTDRSTSTDPRAAVASGGNASTRGSSSAYRPVCSPR